MLETDHELITHCSFLLSYYYPTHLLDEMAKDIALDLREEAVAAADIDSEDDAPVPPQSTIYQPKDERTKQKNEGQTLSLGPTSSRLMMVMKYTDKMGQMIAGATAGSDLVQVKQ
eukprot:jgi/Phyca11/15242/fgenesh1_pg.PHYCAscaffold_12_\